MKQRTEDKGLGSVVIGFMVLVAILILVTGGFSSCKEESKLYEFRYVVEVTYRNDSTETLSGMRKIRTTDPERIQFTVSERFRLRPCLTLDEGADKLGSHNFNVACDVKSFSQHTLDWREIK